MNYLSIKIIGVIVIGLGSVSLKVNQIGHNPKSTKVLIKKGAKFQDSVYRNILLFTTPNREFSDLGGYNLGPYYELEDSVKISIVEQLLYYGKDTSVCSRQVCAIFRSSLDKGKIKPRSSSYTIQIEALLKINSLLFGIDCSYYSPFPVLVDKETGEEINYNHVKIEEVFDIYKRWFIRSKNSGFKNYTFPLSQKDKYMWFNSITVEKKFKEIFKYRLPENFGECR